MEHDIDGVEIGEGLELSAVNALCERAGHLVVSWRPAFWAVLGHDSRTRRKGN